MSILENIRKRTTVLILIIGLALFAFVISGVFTSGELGGNKVGSAIGEINGDEITRDKFNQQLETATRNAPPASSTLQNVNRIWDRMVRNTILEQQFENLGVGIEQDQIVDFIKTTGYAQNPEFQNEDGVFDPNSFRQTVLDWKETNPLQYDAWLQTEQAIIQMAKEQTYFNLIKAGVGATLREGELDYKLANDKIDIKYVRVPYTSIPDSTISVGKSEIAEYIKAHKEEFKQESTRDIQFVQFEENPSEADKNAVKEGLVKLLNDTEEYSQEQDTTYTIPGFRNTGDAAAFLDSHSDIKFDTIYKAKKDLPAKFADSIMTLGKEELFGPYEDGDYYKITKMVDRQPNGSVKASHILITYKGAQRAKPEIERTKEEAEAEAKRLLKEAKKGDTPFVQLARENSDGPSAANGGDLGYFQDGTMVPKFNDFAFGNPIDAVGLVETDFGFHVIKVDDKQDIVQVATLAHAIEPSEETINTLFTDATKFEMESIAAEKTFTDLAKESEYTVRPVNKVKAMDENLPGLGAQRSIVQWAFNEDSDVGDIKRFNINNGYAIVQLTGSYKEGLMSVEDASATVLPKIRKERKAAQIIGANKGKSLEDLAKDNNVSISNATALTVKSPTIPGSGSEPAVIGTAYTMKADETSELIQGESGVFKVMVTKKTEAPKLDNYSTYANNLKTSTVNKVNSTVFNALKEKSDIEDNRADFY
ncbi:MAG: peptidylprolyl isomerase [Bacteroidota bacterium]